MDPYCDERACVLFWEWLHCFILFLVKMSAYDENESKFLRKAKENPFVPLGEYTLCPTSWKENVSHNFTDLKLLRYYKVCCLWYSIVIILFCKSHDYILIHPDCVVVDFVCKLMCFFAFCRNGWILWHCCIQTAENEKPRRHKNVSASDPHACGRSRLCGWSYDSWYVASRGFSLFHAAFGYW